MVRYIFFGFIFSLFLLFSSCQKEPEVIDPCENVECANGNCIEGNCNCDPGWMGDDCKVMRSIQFKGFWEGIMNCTLITDTIGLIVKEGGNPLTELKLQTHNLKYSLGIFSIDFDNYIMVGKIDTSFTKFNIVPLPVTLTIPNAGEFKMTVSGSGNIKSESEMDLTLKIDPENPIIPDINCQGVIKK